MSKHLGFSVMLNMLSSRDEASKAITHALGKKIKAIELKKYDEEESRYDSQDQIRILLGDGSTLVLYDDGQSCCESRYMNTDDDLQSVVGSTLKEISIADGPEERDGDYGDITEVQFLKIKTTKGEITVANYNAHNGYYGGFALDARLEKAK